MTPDEVSTLSGKRSLPLHSPLSAYDRHKPLEIWLLENHALTSIAAVFLHPQSFPLSPALPAQAPLLFTCDNQLQSCLIAYIKLGFKAKSPLNKPAPLTFL